MCQCSFAENVLCTTTNCEYLDKNCIKSNKYCQNNDAVPKNAKQELYISLKNEGNVPKILPILQNYFKVAIYVNQYNLL